MRIDTERGLVLADGHRVAGLTCRCGRPARKGAISVWQPVRLVAHACERCELVVEGAVVFAAEAL